MTATKKNDKFKALLKALQKRYKHAPKLTERKLLDCLMFAACLENASFEAAEAAFSVLEHHYIDWNELRVSTPQEIADTLPMLPAPLEAGERIKKTLQWVFETTYMFDLEDYRKKTIGQTIEYLDSIPSCTPFMTNYLVQAGLGGHLIPFDEAAMRILRRLELTRVQNGKEDVPSAERFVIKPKGAEFAGLLHLMGVEFFEKQNAPEFLAILKTIDPAAEQRSWVEPDGVLKKADIKIVPKTAPPKGFKPDVEMDDEESITADLSAAEESTSFIEHNLASLGAPSKEKAKKNPKSKKTTSANSSKKLDHSQDDLSKSNKDVVTKSDEKKSSGNQNAKDNKGENSETKRTSALEKESKSTEPNQSAARKLQQKKPR